MLEKIRTLLGDSRGSRNETPAGQRFRRCVLHIGTEKTGTSTIQRFLALNRAALAHEGVIYPATTGMHGGSQWAFVASAQEKAWEMDIGVALDMRSPEAQQEYVERLGESLQQEFDEAPAADTLLISSEHLHSRLYNPAQISRLKAYLSAWAEQYEVVLYLRRQDRVAVSLYSTKIKSGNAKPEVFHGNPKGPLPYYFDYEKIYQNWLSVFGEEALRVRLFGPDEFEGGDLLTDFCSVVGLQQAGKKIPAPENIALDPAGAAFLLELNRQLPNAADGRVNPDRVALAQLVSNLSSGGLHPVTREQARQFYDRCAEANERLKSRLFPGRSKPLFDEDFSDYPESLEGLAPRYADAVSIAIGIWRALR